MQNNLDQVNQNHLSQIVSGLMFKSLTIIDVYWQVNFLTETLRWTHNHQFFTRQIIKGKRFPQCGREENWEGYDSPSGAHARGDETAMVTEETGLCGEPLTRCPSPLEGHSE